MLSFDSFYRLIIFALLVGSTTLTDTFLASQTFRLMDAQTMGDDAPIFWERRVKIAEFLTHWLPSYPVHIAVSHFE